MELPIECSRRIEQQLAGACKLGMDMRGVRFRALAFAILEMAKGGHHDFWDLIIASKLSGIPLNEGCVTTASLLFLGVCFLFPAFRFGFCRAVLGLALVFCCAALVF